MSDDPTKTTDDEQATPSDSGEQLGDTGKKALDAERAARRKAERDAAALKARLDEIEQQNLSELERAQKAAADAQAEMAAMRTREMRARVALEKGLPANLVDRLRGDTEDDLTADADALLALVNAPRTPAPDLTQGGGQGTTPARSTAEQFADFADNL